jgi:exodeoxyribonuclease V alpha subunit
MTAKQTYNDVHQQFSSFFRDEQLKPFAWLLSKRMEEGHICIPIADLWKEANLNPWPVPSDSAGLFKCYEHVSTDPEKPKPFILFQNKLYLHRYFHYETEIIKSIHRLLEEERSLYQKRSEALSDLQSFVSSLTATGSLEGINENEKIDWQLVAAIQAFMNSFSIITGGPGTGKTTTVAKVLSILYTHDPTTRVALAAPTGKAAVRMAESLKQTTLSLDPAIKNIFEKLMPSTLHRLLKFIPDSVHFKHNAENPLPYDVIIVDEASMIDVPLFAKLLNAIKMGARIILLGDRNQLASVEAGSLLSDLCKCMDQVNGLSAHSIQTINPFITDRERKVSDAYQTDSKHPLTGHIIELQRSHRFTSNSGIGKLSKAIITNNSHVLKDIIHQNTDPGITIDQVYDENIFHAFVQGYEEYIQEVDIAAALQKLGSLRVLVAVKEGEQGLYRVNARIEESLRSRGLIRKDNIFYEHRPIIVTKNNKDLHLYNGDIGIIRKDDNGNLKAWFEDSDGQLRSVIPAYLTEAETVFAMTIHKSQGSEYNRVLVMLPDNSENPMLTRELLYTAVTRARKNVIIQAREKMILSTAAAEVQRGSGIEERLKPSETPES